MTDSANAYEMSAGAFIGSRDPQVGVDIVRDWAGEFSPGAEVLELGCGHGAISSVLVEAGLNLFAIDASPTLLSLFRERFPGIETECSRAEDSSFFGRRFDGVVAWGLVFLLDQNSQPHLFDKIGKALKTGGRLLFTAPRQAAQWPDRLTELPSHSLGAASYEQLLRSEGLEVLPGATDSGENYYYFAVKR